MKMRGTSGTEKHGVESCAAADGPKWTAQSGREVW